MMLPWFLVILLFMKYQKKKVDWKKKNTEVVLQNSLHMERKKQSTLKYSQSFQMAFFPSDEDQSHQTPLFSHCFKVTTRIFYWLDRRHSMGSPVNNWLVSTAPLCMTPCPEPGHLKWPVVNQICSLWRVKNGEFMRVALCFINNVCFKMTNGQTDECLSWRQRAVI